MSLQAASGATELDVFTCPLDGVNQIEASAGTGKTWNICALYVRLLLEQNLRVDQILVVTFTKAATAELHERIRGRLAGLEHALEHDDDAGDPFIRWLRETTLATARPDEHDGAPLQRVRRALRAFDQAAIHTIHAFCQHALQEAPFAAALPFTFELVSDDEALRFEVAATFWRNRIEPAASAASGFAAWLVRHGAGPAALSEQLRRRQKKPLARLCWGAASASADQPLDGVGSEPDLTAIFDAARSLWLGECEAIAGLLADASASLNQRTHKPAMLEDAQRAWSHYFAEADCYRALPKEALKLTTAALQRATKAKGVTPTHAFFEMAEELAAAAALAEQYYAGRWLDLLRGFLDWGPVELQRAKRSRRVVSFDDLLADLHNALQRHAWLADAIREHYPAALIDEFQDTDPLQFEIFNRIFAPAGPLFLVGDPKQAIYSFRAADLHTYLNARALASACYTLSVNQRSSAELIEACNRIFSTNPAGFVLPDLVYRPVRAGERPRPPFFDPQAGSDSATAAAFRVWLLPAGESRVLAKRAAQRAAAEACAAEIARLLRAARAGTARLGELALAPGDIAVLVQTHKQGSLVKRVLAGWGIGSVELAQASVFGTVDAEQFERVLLAIDAPGDMRRLRAALATDWIGGDAAALWRLGRSAEIGIDGSNDIDGTDATPWVERFTRYRTLWHERGFALMWRTLLRELRVAPRVVASPDGERRLTNLGHLAELIQARAAEQPGIAPVMRWLAAQRATPGGGDEAQLRLESDRNLVQIVTVHKAKGLEYAVVFCPFLADGALHATRTGDLPDAREYHDESGVAVLHYGYDEATAERAAQDANREQAAERARLIYVALTRAVYRCYLVAGVYTTGQYASTKEARQSVLNWLVAGAGRSFEAWLAEPPDDAGVLAAWQALGDAVLTLEALPESQRREPLAPVPTGAVTWRARRAVRPLRDNWRIGSFSSLIAGLNRAGGAGGDRDDARPDYDALAAASDADGSDEMASAHALPALPPVPRGADDILDFPRGAAAGECLHRMFELADFSAAHAWPSAVERALRERPAPAPVPLAERLPAMMLRLLHDVTHTELVAGLRLSSIVPARRLNELEFLFPAAALDLSALRALLVAHGYPDMALDAGTLRGYLKGFIDLIFEHDKRFWILDWKSNYLGEHPSDYRRAALDAAMQGHAYHLQALFYTVALHRYLKLRVAGYDYDSQVGGCLYLFVRGVRPDWRDGPPGIAQAGVHVNRASLELVEALERLMQGGTP